MEKRLENQNRQFARREQNGRAVRHFVVSHTTQGYKEVVLHVSRAEGYGFKVYPETLPIQADEQGHLYFTFEEKRYWLDRFITVHK